MINQLNIITGKLSEEKLKWAKELGSGLFVEHYNDLSESNLLDLLHGIDENRKNGEHSFLFFVNGRDKDTEMRWFLSHLISYKAQLLKTTTFFLVDDIKTVPKYVMDEVDLNIIEFKEEKKEV